MVYLISLRAIDRDSYIKFASEFKLFEETIRDAFASDLSDAVWHD
jgi:transcriptional regulator NrdR family protein